MKKLLILAGVVALTMSSQVFAADTSTVTTKEAQPVQQKQQPCCKCNKQKMHKPPFDKAKFEKRLKLTDEQKAQAKEIRAKGHQQMEPVMQKMKETRAQMDAVRKSKIAVQEQEEQLAKLRNEMRDLRKQANEIRMQNMKEFESILTKKQLKELNKMKKEGRKAFEKAHKKQILRMPPMPPMEDGQVLPPPAPVKE